MENNSQFGEYGLVFIAGKITRGTIQSVDRIQGERIAAICHGGKQQLVVCTPNGMFDLRKREFSALVEQISPVFYASGVKHHLLLDSTGSLYSWGVGELGELGLGTPKKLISTPTQIVYDAKFTSISCGEVHSSALDERGNAYAWGQNRSRQLGLYTKSKEDMRCENCLVEDFLFRPRVLPFSLRCPVTKISCGSRFTIAVTKQGQLWSWGGGECGQLGMTSSAVKEVPSPLPLPHVLPEMRFIDAAAGYAHVLALSSEGRVFAWGLNAKNQLGLGDESQTKHTPIPTLVKASESSDFQVTAVFANSHCSAWIDSLGRLFTWGSNSFNKLMHRDPSKDSFPIPKLVEHFIDSRVSGFAFASEESAVLVTSRILSMSPTSGPTKKFSKLRLTGCGFWNSQDCIVRFKLISGGRVVAGKMIPCPPRSCTGQLISGDQIECIPPKLVCAGQYEVALSLNGKDFLNDTFTLDAYIEPSVVSVEPKLVSISSRSTVDIELVSYSICMSAIY